MASPTFPFLYFTTWEGLFIDVFHERVHNKITIGNVYRPPRQNNNNSAIQLFIDEISPILTKLSNERADTFLLGDFNINLLEVNNRIKFQEYLDLFTTQIFYPQTVHPTRFSKKRATLIDQIYCKLTDKS